jgi:hypothetical protein
VSGLCSPFRWLISFISVISPLISHSALIYKALAIKEKWFNFIFDNINNSWEKTRVCGLAYLQLNLLSFRHLKQCRLDSVDWSHWTASNVCLLWKRARQRFWPAFIFVGLCAWTVFQLVREMESSGEISTVEQVCKSLIALYICRCYTVLETHYASGHIIRFLYYSSSIKTGRIIRRTISIYCLCV